MPAAKARNGSLMDETRAFFDEQRQEIKTECQQRLEEINRNETLVREALSGIHLNGRRKGTKAQRKANGGYTLSVSDEKYQKVIEYLRKHGETRQADLAKKLTLNSGQVSVALKIGRQKKDARLLPGKRDRSKVWAPVENRETVVQPGVGAKRGRLAAVSSS